MGSALAIRNNFKAVSPSEKVIEQYRNHLASLHAARAKKMAEHEKWQREGRAAFRDSVMKLLMKRDFKSPQERKFEFGSRKLKSAHEETARVAKLHPRGMPQNGPYSGWVVGEDASPSNNASSGGSFNQKSQVAMSLAAGMNEQQGGSTTVWGYVGQYIQQADLPQNEDSVQLTVNTSCSIVINPSWTITNYCSTFSENATLIVWLNIICQEWDSSWENYLGTLQSPNQQIYTNQSPDSGSYNWGSDEPSTQLVLPVSFSPTISTDSNLGIFVCLSAWASAAGESTGALVPGSEIMADVTGTLEAMNISYQVNV
jgi:hypothetical protein